MNYNTSKDLKHTMLQILNKKEKLLKKNTPSSDNENDDNNNFTMHNVSILNKCLFKMNLYCKCYLRIFDGLILNKYVDAKGEMCLYNATISIGTFTKILENAGLKVIFGSMYKLKKHNKCNDNICNQLIKIEENIGSTYNIVVHKVIFDKKLNYCGHICSKYFIYKTNPKNFKEELCKIGFIGGC